MAADRGTRIANRVDLKLHVQQTTGGAEPRIYFDGRTEVLVAPTRMQAILERSGLSQRQWAKALGKTHPTIGNWRAADPTTSIRHRLEQIADALDYAGRRRTDLALWLQAPVPGMQTTPLELIQENRLRAFRGAVHAAPASRSITSEQDLRNLLHLDVSWPAADAAVLADDEA